jgi:DNA-binding CsgD family transcriptional regulator
MAQSVPTRLLRQTMKLIRGVQTRAEILDVALPAVRTLIGADVASSVAIGPGSVVGRPAFDPPDAMQRADLAAYVTFRHQQPLIGEYRMRGASAPMRTTDVISMRHFMQLDLYRHFYQPLGIKYQLAIAVAENKDWTAAYTLSRTSCDFDDQGTETMALLQVSLAGAHHCVAMESLRRQFEAVSLLLQEGEHGRVSCLVVIDANDRIECAAGPLLPQVEGVFGKLTPRTLAPARLARLVGASHASFRTVVEIGEGATADVLTCPNGGAGGSLLFELRSRDDLRSRYGLTPGEYRTLANIVRYETNERAAAAEGVSVPTIEKRMTSVMRKMNVESRVGAVREFLTG